MIPWRERRRAGGDIGKIAWCRTAASHKFPDFGWRKRAELSPRRMVPLEQRDCAMGGWLDGKHNFSHGSGLRPD